MFSNGVVTLSTVAEGAAVMLLLWRGNNYTQLGSKSFTWRDVQFLRFVKSQPEFNSFERTQTKQIAVGRDN